MNNASLSRTLAGIGIISLGVLAALGAVDVINFSALWNSWWPVILLATGGLMMLANPRNWGWPVLFMTFGALALVRTLGYKPDFEPFQLFWPAVLIVFGLSLLRGKTTRVSVSSDEDSFALLGGSESKNTSKDYRGGKTTAILGGTSLDLREAVIKKQATINITVFCGGVELRIPETWVVKNQLNAVLGGAEIKTGPQPGANAPVLILTGDIIMGGVEVK